MFSATKRTGAGGGVWFECTKAERRVGVYYFYVLDPRLRGRVHQDLHLLPVSGQGVGQRPRVGQTPSRPGRRRLHGAGQRVRRLRRARRVCRRSATGSGPPTCKGSSTAGSRVIPTPFTAADRAAGYWWELSMRQVEVSRTLVFDDPRRARGFFEALVTDNIGIGRPERGRRRVRPPGPQDHQGAVPHPGLHARHRRARSTSATSTAASSST